MNKEKKWVYRICLTNKLHHYFDKDDVKVFSDGNGTRITVILHNGSFWSAPMKRVLWWRLFEEEQIPPREYTGPRGAY